MFPPCPLVILPGSSKPYYLDPVARNLSKALQLLIDVHTDFISLLQPHRRVTSHDLEPAKT